MNACCNGWSVPSAFSKPSMVVTFLPRASYAKYVQALTGAPSINTVQAPQTWTSQETLVPLRFSVLRRTSTRVSAGSQSTSLALPLSWNESFISSNNWSNGVVEYWSVGFSSTHCSITPLLQRLFFSYIAAEYFPPRAPFADSNYPSSDR